MRRAQLEKSPDRPLPNTYWVVPGRLLAGEYPGGDDSSDSRNRLARLEDCGVDYIVDLTVEGELPEYRHLLSPRTMHLRFAILDTWIPDSVQQTRQLLADIQTALAAGHCVYVHCRAGIGRTGLIIGCFLAESEASGKAALKDLNRLWKQSERSSSWPKLPQTAQQAEYIRRWTRSG